MQENIKILASNMRDYKLLDCGDKKKLEEVGGKRIVRSEPRAWWKPLLPKTEWERAEIILEKVIDIGIEGIKAKIKFKSGSKHIGIFPEQIREWKFIKEKIEEEKKKRLGKEINILNLFGYTGIASLVAVKAGAKVTHIDASKQSVEWARENQKLSGLEDAPVRWIVDDVIKFIKKEVRRGEKYDAIIMDPPSYGKGPKGEVWKIEEKLPDLLAACREILSNQPLFVIFNMYSTELSSISVANLLSDMVNGLSGTTESGELAIKQENFYPDRSVGADRLLPMSIFAMWQK
jgi:23S rRNA (cytosine1962-C5)-methyltransferase